MQAGNHTSLQYSIVAVKSIPVLTQCSIVTVHSVPPALARPPAKASPRTSRRAFLSILVAACTLDMASRILPERTVPMPSGRQIVSPANDREVGPRYEVLGRNRGFRAVRGESYLLACPILLPSVPAAALPAKDRQGRCSAGSGGCCPSCGSQHPCGPPRCTASVHG